MLEYEELRLELNGYKDELSDLKSALDLEKLTEQIKDLEQKTTVDGFWDDVDNSQKVLQKISKIKNTVSDYNSLEGQFDDALALIELADEAGELDMLDEVKSAMEAFVKTLKDRKLATLLSGEYDSNNAILTFHAGAGGTEAQDWAQMLVRMYTHWGESKGFNVKMIDFLDGEEAGYKSCVLLVEGTNAYGYLKCESGVHRLVRVSPFDASGRRHTSFASLEVMPEIDDSVDVQIKPDDIKVDTYRSSGAGGQHVNKTESAIRITHIPTGIVVACQNERSQHQNREVAMKMLISKLIEIKERENLDKIEDIKGVQKDNAWGSQIRSYVFMPYTLAKDHRTGFENGNIGAVMDGDLDGFINAYLIAASKGEIQK